MSDAEQCHRAAERIRAELCYGGSGHQFYKAVADWLEDLSQRWSHDATGAEMDQGLAVAHGFLGGRA